MDGENQPEKRRGALSAFFNSRAAQGCKLALKAAGLYLWPFAARWDRPFSREGAWQKLRRIRRGGTAFALLLIAHQVIQGGTGTLFPTGEEYLRAQNLDPALVQELSDRPMRIRGRGFWGRLHAMNDMPTIVGVMSGVGLMALPGNAYAMPGENRGNLLSRVLPPAFTHCRVMLQGDVDARTTLALLANMPREKLEHVPLTDREAQLAVAFHEMAHCHSGNRANAPEGDADARGIGALAKALDRPEIAQAFLYARALNANASSHDTALYFDAARQGKTLEPAVSAESGRASRDIFTLSAIFMRNVQRDDGRDIHVLRALAMKQLLHGYGNLLDDKAKRRATLYIEAVDYYMPQAMREPPRVGPR